MCFFLFFFLKKSLSINIGLHLFFFPPPPLSQLRIDLRTHLALYNMLIMRTVLWQCLKDYPSKTNKQTTTTTTKTIERFTLSVTTFFFARLRLAKLRREEISEKNEVFDLDYILLVKSMQF